jgi:hypothetical protein
MGIYLLCSVTGVNCVGFKMFLSVEYCIWQVLNVSNYPACISLTFFTEENTICIEESSNINFMDCFHVVIFGLQNYLKLRSLI